jgi:hypothetical protein
MNSRTDSAKRRLLQKCRARHTKNLEKSLTIHVRDSFFKVCCRALSLSFSAFEIFSARISKVTRSNVVGTSLPHIALRQAAGSESFYAALILHCEMRCVAAATWSSAARRPSSIWMKPIAPDQM